MNLKAQQDILNARLVKVMNMVAHLQEVNQKKERKTDEVRSFVQDLLRVFNHDVSSISSLASAASQMKLCQLTIFS
jgi:hypothetical protein